MSLIIQVRHFLKFKIRPPRACIGCDVIVFFKIPLCGLCRKYFYSQYKNNIDEITWLDDASRTCVLSLWHWDESNDVIIQKLIVSLKDGHNPKLYDLFSGWMLKKIESFHLPIRYNVCSVPSFDRKHPEKLGQVFSKRFNSNYLPLIRKQKPISQKNMGKAQRQEVAFEKKDLKFTPKPQNLILVDDVISTGASLKSCLKALKPHRVKYIVVWAEKH